MYETILPPNIVYGAGTKKFRVPVPIAHKYYSTNTKKHYTQFNTDSHLTTVKEYNKMLDISQESLDNILQKNENVVLDYEGGYKDYEDPADYIRTGRIRAEVIA